MKSRWRWPRRRLDSVVSPLVKYLCFLEVFTVSLTDIFAGAVITTKVKEVVAWGRKYSLWPMPYATACCGIEFMGAVSSYFDISRFGAELVRFSPRQADL